MGTSSRDEFARALRTHRLRASLTQEELAHRSGISVRTVRNVESGAVGVPRLATLRTLAESLRLEGEERDRFLAVATGDGERAGASGGGRIPVSLSSLVGRDRDVAAITDVIVRGTDRLLTLTGVAGIGKTRLALAATSALGRSRWRTWWVPLAAVGDSTYILDAVVDAVGAPGGDLGTLASWIGDDPALVTIDNLEHLDGAGHVLTDLLRAVPGLTVLVTSRAPIGVPGEREWPVRPLAVPTPGVPGDDGRQRPAAAVELLLDRVRSTVPDFDATGPVAEDVAEICRRLDGVPLALELAAGQWRVLGARGVLAAIAANPLDLRDVAGHRLGVHASLRSALLASSALLEERELATFAALSVFRGGWTVAAAAEVTAVGAPEVVAHLDRLIALGLVQTSLPGADELRFTMLQTIEAFAVERATELGVRAAAEQRHARWVASLVAASELDLRSGVAQAAVRRLDSERDNVRAALRWFQRHDPEGGVAVVLVMHRYWTLRNRTDESLAWFGTFLDLAGSSERAALARTMAAGVAVSAGRLAEAQVLADHGLADSRRTGDARGASMALVVLGLVAAGRGDLRRAAELITEALGMAQHLDDPWLLTWTLSHLGIALAELGPTPEARDQLERARALARVNGFLATEAWVLLALADHHRLHGELAIARDRLDTCEDLLPAVNQLDLDALCPAVGAVVAAWDGDLVRADELAGTARRTAAAAGRTARGTALWALAESRLAAGEPEPELFAAALDDLDDPGRPLRRLEALAGLALTDDDAVAARAVSAADELVTRLEPVVPAVVRDRLSRARRRLAGRTADPAS